MTEPSPKRASTFKFDMLTDIEYKYYGLTPNLHLRPKRNVVSCAIFKMEDNYRDFSKYSEILRNVSEQYISKLAEWNFVFRIYYDVNCRKELHDTFKRPDDTYPPGLELVEYNCPKFKSRTNPMYHLGTFGTFVRFLPHFQNEFNYVFVTDVNHSTFQLAFMINQIRECMQRGFKTCYIYINSYRYSSPKELCIPELNNILLANVHTNEKVPLSNINNFMTGICKGDHNVMIDALIAKHGEKTANVAYPFVYAFDEYYMNKFFFKYQEKHCKDIQFLIVRDNRISTTLRYLTNHVKKEHQIEFDDTISRAQSDADYSEKFALYSKIRKNILKRYRGNKESDYYKTMLLLPNYGYNIFDSVSKYNEFSYLSYNDLVQIII
jgi:hypothetical protein